MNGSKPILNCVGKTPLLRVDRLEEARDFEILAKAEYLNPSGSIKDRIAVRMFASAEKRGILHGGSRIVEASSGNTGIALSMVAAIKGYPITIYVPKSVFGTPRTKIMEGYGAEIIPVESQDFDPNDRSIHGARAEILPRFKCRDAENGDRNVWWARQFNNPDNKLAHKEGTAQEILGQTEGRIDAFTASVGTGGTVFGIGEALKEFDRRIHIYATEPLEKPHMYIEGNDFPVIAGITDGFVLDLVKSKICEEIIRISSAEAIEMAHRLMRVQGLFCGISAGANVAAAIRIGQKLGKGSRIVTVLPDSRDRYFDFEAYIT